jgi:hypothetical protein
MYPWLAHIGGIALDKLEGVALSGVGLYLLGKGKSMVSRLRRRLQLRPRESRVIFWILKKSSHFTRAAVGSLKKVNFVPRGFSGDGLSFLPGLSFKKI